MLDKKSSIYSDRPILQMGGELVGWKNSLALIPYGDRFRRFRRLFYQCIGNNASMKQYLPSEELETRRFLRRVLTKPGDLGAHVRKFVDPLTLTTRLMNMQEPLERSFFASLTATKFRKVTTLLLSSQIKPRNNFP